MESFSKFIDEGVNDPSIFKAVFLAGGPGSGKSFIAGRTALQALGFKLINSDIAFERALKDAGMDASNPDDLFSPEGQLLRTVAKKLTAKQKKLAIKGRLGLVIDGTGKDFATIKAQVVDIKNIGYDVAMIFVNTNLETSIARNRERERSLPDSSVESMWNKVFGNIGKFQNLFGKDMYIVDNSIGSNWEGATNSVYRKISKWAKEKPNNFIAKGWISSRNKA